MLSVSEEFRNKLESKVSHPRIRFIFDGHDYDKFLLNVSQISRSSDITLGFASIELSNIREKTWNIFLADRTNLGKSAQLKLYFYGYYEAKGPRYGSSIYYIDEEKGIKVASSGKDDNPRDRYVYVGGVLRHTTERSWAVTKCDANWNWVETQQFDCYSDINEATAMKDYLNSLPNGTNVIINTYDEPRTNVYDNDDLIAALEAVGATGSVIRTLELRGSYLLVGQKGLGAGKALEHISLFTGTVEEASFKEAEVTLRIRDKMLPMLEKELGYGQNPLNYYSTDYNPADLVWDILTNYGGLDSIASSDNEDMDYDSWSQWKDDCDTLSFRLKARFTGHTIKTALSMIAELTNSYIWVDGDGKFHFKRPIPPYAPGELIDFNRSNCTQIDASLDKGNLINKTVCYYGYDPDSDDFTGSYTAEDVTSQSNYGVKEKVIENKVVWHSTSGSAKSYADRIVDKNKQPLEVLSITATMIGYLLQLGDDITITEELKDLNSNPARVEEIESIDLRTGLVKFKAREISDEALAAFWLDDPYWGLLDGTHNPLY